MSLSFSFDTPPHKCGRCSVLCRSLRHGSATAPRRACPARSMLLAAFSSRSNTSPPVGCGQTGVRADTLVRIRSCAPASHSRDPPGWWRQGARRRLDAQRLRLGPRACSRMLAHGADLRPASSRQQPRGWLAGGDAVPCWRPARRAASAGRAARPPAELPWGGRLATVASP